MKLLLDFLPILLFFATFKYAEGHKDWAAAFATEHFGFMVSGGVVGQAEAPVLLATVVVIAATLAQVAWLKAASPKVDLMLWVSLAWWWCWAA
jgi:intracellular septation protein